MSENELHQSDVFGDSQETLGKNLLTYANLQGNRRHLEDSLLDSFRSIETLVRTNKVYTFESIERAIDCCLTSTRRRRT